MEGILTMFKFTTETSQSDKSLSVRHRTCHLESPQNAPLNVSSLWNVSGPVTPNNKTAQDRRHCLKNTSLVSRLKQVVFAIWKLDAEIHMK